MNRPTIIDTLILNRPGWSFHVVKMNDEDIAAFMIHSEHHPAETIWVENVFISAMEEGLDGKKLKFFEEWRKENLACPFFCIAPTIKDAMNYFRVMLDKSLKEETFDQDLANWKDFLDGMYYKT